MTGPLQQVHTPSQHFLESAERFFMQGVHACTTTFSLRPPGHSSGPTGPGRHLSVIPVPGPSQWEEASIADGSHPACTSPRGAHREVDYLFCLDVDMAFRNPWGRDLGGTLWLPSTGLLHRPPPPVPPTNAGLSPPPSWHTARGTSTMAGQSSESGWPGCTSSPGAATWASWQTKPAWHHGSLAGGEPPEPPASSRTSPPRCCP